MLFIEESLEVFWKILTHQSYSGWLHAFSWHKFLNILTWKCASHHSSVQFFNSSLKTWLRTRRFSEPTFRPSRSRPTNHWKNSTFRDFPNISRDCIFLLLLPSSDSTFLWLYLLLTLLRALLSFSSFHIDGSFVLTSHAPRNLLQVPFWCLSFIVAWCRKWGWFSKNGESPKSMTLPSCLC